MKRRSFLSAAGTVGTIGVATGATSITSLYSNINTSVLLSDFDMTSKAMLDKLINDAKENALSLGLDPKLSKRLAMPVHIISNDFSNGDQRIVYKNKAGLVISMSVDNDVEKISFL